MKATDLLKQDHEQLKKLFKAFDSSKDSPEACERIFEQVSQELEVHSAIEEEIFYPELSDYEETKEIVAESIEEHHVVDVLIDEIRGLTPQDEAFVAKFEVLKENVLHHAEEEEDELFPEAERLLGEERMSWLGDRLADRKQELIGEAKPPAGAAGGRKRA